MQHMLRLALQAHTTAHSAFCSRASTSSHWGFMSSAATTCEWLSTQTCLNWQLPPSGSLPTLPALPLCKVLSWARWTSAGGPGSTLCRQSSPHPSHALVSTMWLPLQCCRGRGGRGGRRAAGPRLYTRAAAQGDHARMTAAGHQPLPLSPAAATAPSCRCCARRPLRHGMAQGARSSAAPLARARLRAFIFPLYMHNLLRAPLKTPAHQECVTVVVLLRISHGMWQVWEAKGQKQRGQKARRHAF